ncbi:MAG: metallophosphoesterase family protein [Acidobacteria bacterium]|nr:metallophosphoesterase family protein [Acidobacteriota bacterium]
MRYLVLSDIHGNLQALEAVLTDARAIGYDHVLVLGDLVGYGADPDAVVDATFGLEPLAMVRGNHDRVAAAISSASDFHDQARAAIEWTRRALTPDNTRRLHDLPEGPIDVAAGMMICHGAPFDEDHYIFDAQDAWRALNFAPRAGEPPMLCLYGHTHVPAAFAATSRGVEVLLPDQDATDPSRATWIPWDRTRGLLVNVGAVGQPRDGDPRAAYGIVDTLQRRIVFRRVEYDIKTAQERIRAAGLPDRLASRLDRGA